MSSGSSIFGFSSAQIKTSEATVFISVIGKNMSNLKEDTESLQTVQYEPSLRSLRHQDFPCIAISGNLMVKVGFVVCRFGPGLFLMQGGIRCNLLIHTCIDL